MRSESELGRRIVLVRHDNGPEDDRVQAWAARNRLAHESRRPFAGDSLGAVDEEVVASVVFGGPFDAYDYDRYPFLRNEARWIERCIENGTPLLGICQGAQQIAHVLGAKIGPVTAGLCEFGCYEVRPTPQGRDVLPHPLHFTQRHFHTFEIPQGATHLASSALFANQAFSYGERVFAFQFHPELSPAAFRRWQETANDYGRPGVQSREEQDRLVAAHHEAQAAWFDGFLDRWLPRAA